MNAATISTATAPDGTTFEKVSRKGKHFPYAVIAETRSGWEVFSFHSSQRAAESKASSEQAWWTGAGRSDEYDDFTVVETTKS